MEWIQTFIISPRDAFPKIAGSNFKDALQRYFVNRRLAFTQKNRPISVPWNAEVGNEICILHSSSVPTLMRVVHIEGDFYRLIGTALAYGPMDREVIRDSRLIRQENMS